MTISDSRFENGEARRHEKGKTTFLSKTMCFETRHCSVVRIIKKRSEEI